MTTQRDLPPPGSTARTAVRRHPERASASRDEVYAVLDEGLVAHVGMAIDGQPFVLPMVYARLDDTLLLHGSKASRLARHLAAGAPVCVTVTLLDGLVLARSAFHHSMNYRSVVVVGSAQPVTDPVERAVAFARFIDHVVPGRSAEVRAPSPVEDRQTLLLSLELAECSLKARDGGPVDEPEDLDLDVWAGVLPLTVVHGAAQPDGEPSSGLAAPVGSGVARAAR